MPDILHLLKIRAPAERVYAALTTPEGVRSWWTRDADLDTSVGGIGEFRFYGGNRVSRVRIELLERPKQVAWKVLSSFHESWGGTTITFDVRSEEGAVTLAFAHRGFEWADDAYALFTTGWVYYLVSLRQYLETGSGAPHPDVDFARVIHAA